VIGVENDTTTPTDHAVALYDAARGPRELILQRHTSHYASYEANGAAIAARIVEWFERYLVGGHLVVRSRPGAAEAPAP
jgi:dipeptidyl aminopeptidase/acylaminoacyl peptidase